LFGNSIDYDRAGGAIGGPYEYFRILLGCLVQLDDIGRKAIGHDGVIKALGM
jgi:hypothetical protein